MTDVAQHFRTAIVRDDGPTRLGADVRIGVHRLRADEPIAAGGRETGPDPFEYLLAGLGACTVMTVRLYADRKGWALANVQARVRHVERLGAGAPRDVFSREIWLEGDLSEEERARLLEIADRCPVSRTLAGGVAIQSKLADQPPAGEATS